MILTTFISIQKEPLGDGITHLHSRYLSAWMICYKTKKIVTYVLSPDTIDGL